MTMYAQEASKAHRTHREAVQAARSFTDPDLTPEALRRKREELETAADDAKATELSKIAQAAESQAYNTRLQAGLARPKLTDHANAAAIWQNVYKPLLDAGRSMRQVLAKADTVGVQAIQAFAPAYFDAKQANPGVGLSPIDVPDVARLADDRLIELGGDAATRIAAERDAQADLEKAQVYTQASTGESDLQLAIRAKLTGVAVADE